MEHIGGSLTKSDGSSGRLSGTLSISSDGVITCVAGSCLDPNFESFMDAGKSVMVGTSTAAPTGQDVLLRVFTRKAASYSMADLAGTWQVNSLASGPGAPWWERMTTTVGSKGKFISSGTENGGGVDNGGGAFSISPGGVISLVIYGKSGAKSHTVVGVMDAAKTVFVGTSTWDGNTDPGTADLFIGAKSASVPGAPTGVTAMPGDAQATVSFTAPASDGDSAITGYTVISKPHLIKARGVTSPIIVKHLTNGTRYAFIVKATNAAGTGPASNPSNRVKPTKVPGAPTKATATAGSTQATVSFKLPANDGRPITGCTVTSDPGGLTGKGSGSPITVQNLTNGTAYRFTVTATNKIGTGPASMPSNEVTPQ
jgi:hypothetical protein